MSNEAIGQLQGNISPAKLESLKRAVSGQSLTNLPAIFAGFAAKGIPEDQIKPREKRLHIPSMESIRGASFDVASMASRWSRSSSRRAGN